MCLCCKHISRKLVVHMMHIKILNNVDIKKIYELEPVRLLLQSTHFNNTWSCLHIQILVYQLYNLSNLHRQGYIETFKVSYISCMKVLFHDTLVHNAMIYEFCLLLWEDWTSFMHETQSLKSNLPLTMSKTSLKNLCDHHWIHCCPKWKV